MNFMKNYRFLPITLITVLLLTSYCTFKKPIQNEVLLPELFHAIKKNDVQKTDSILNLHPGQIHAKDSMGKSALYFAARYNKEEILSGLIKKGADVNAVTNNNETALHIASSKKKHEIVSILLEHNANVEIKTKAFGLTALHNACWKGDSVIVKMLIENGADVNSKTKYNNTPLHKVALKGNCTIAKMLLPAGTDVNARNIFGDAPLHRAARYGYKEMCELLIQHGADLKATRNDGAIPYHSAIEEGQKEIAGLFVKHGADTLPKHFPELKGTYFGLKRPGLVPEIFAPGIVSSHHLEHGWPIFFPGGNEIHWSSHLRPEREGGMITYMIKKSNGFWASPQITSLSGTVFLKDGNQALFLHKAIIPGIDDPNLPFREIPPRIWAADKTENGWGEPYPYMFGGDSLNFGWVFHVTNKGNFYFKNLKGIYCSEIIDGQLGYPEMTDLDNNYEGFSFLMSPEEDYYIISAWNLGGYGWEDLFIYFKMEDGTWSERINMGPEINTWATERFPGFSPDGKYLFYTRGNPEEEADIFWVSIKIIDKLRKEYKK